MTPTFTYEQAVLVQRIMPSKLLPEELCTLYSCWTCPIRQPQAVNSPDNCPFSQAYSGGFKEALVCTRRDMRAQFPPEQYPELYI